MSATGRVKELLVGVLSGAGLGTWTSFGVAIFLTGVLDPVWMPWRFSASVVLLVVPSMLGGAVVGLLTGLRRVRGDVAQRERAAPAPSRSATAMPVVLFASASLLLGGASAVLLLRGGRHAGRGAILLVLATLLVVAAIAALTGRRLARRTLASSPEAVDAARHHALAAWIPAVATTLGGIGLLRWPPVPLITLGLPALLATALGSLLPIVWFTRPAR